MTPFSEWAPIAYVMIAAMYALAIAIPFTILTLPADMRQLGLVVCWLVIVWLGLAGFFLHPIGLVVVVAMGVVTIIVRRRLRQPPVAER